MARGGCHTKEPNAERCCRTLRRIYTASRQFAFCSRPDSTGCNRACRSVRSINTWVLEELGEAECQLLARSCRSAMSLVRQLVAGIADLERTRSNRRD